MPFPTPVASIEGGFNTTCTIKLINLISLTTSETHFLRVSFSVSKVSGLGHKPIFCKGYGLVKICKGYGLVKRLQFNEFFLCCICR